MTDHWDTIEDALENERIAILAHHVTTEDAAHIDAAIAIVREMRQQPQPDWTTAPEWAEWWTMDKDGKQEWWEKEPMLDDRYVWWLYDWSKAPYRHERIEYRPDKNGIDWRTLKRRRPEDAQPKEGGSDE